MLWRRMIAGVKNLCRDHRGNVLMLTGFAIIPLTFSTGMVIDYSRAARLQTKINAVADAAALSATAKPMLAKPIVTACDVVRKAFAQQATGQSGLTLNPFADSDLTIRITEKYATGADVVKTCPTTTETAASGAALPVNRVVVVTYNGRSANAFGGVLGSPSIAIGGTSTAQSGSDVFYQIVFVVDVSSSMGIGGTSTDIDNLRKNKLIKCAFACHDANGAKTYEISTYCALNSQDYFCLVNGPNYCPYGSGKCGDNVFTSAYSDKRKLAKQFGYKLKIDYVNEAIGNFLTQLKPIMEKSPDRFVVGIDTLGTNSAQLRSPTNSYSLVKAASDAIDVEVAGPQPMPYNHGWTYISDGLAGSYARATNVGDGSSTTKRKTYFIFLSDGVQDIPGNIIYGRKTDLTYVTKCQDIKTAGVTIFSIDTGYPAVPEDEQYEKLILNLPSSDIPIAMRNCASSADRYFMASDGPAIRTASDQVFSAIFAESSRLSR